MTGLGVSTDLSTTLDGVVLSHRALEGDVPILMVHGIGPGTTGLANFGPILLAPPRHAGLHWIDLAGFGASGRKTQPPFFDVAFWLRQIGLAVDAVIARHGRPPILVGNSVGGALALKLAARRSDLRHVVAIGAPAGPPATDTLRGFWRAPRDAASLAERMRPMTAAAAAPDPHLVSARLQPFLEPGYASYFDTMLADPEACLASVVLQPQEALRIEAHVTLVHGREDRACPALATVSRLLPLLPRADLILLRGCGHNVITERTADVLARLARLVEKVDLQ